MGPSARYKKRVALKREFYPSGRYKMRGTRGGYKKVTFKEFSNPSGGYKKSNLSRGNFTPLADVIRNCSLWRVF